MNNCNCDKARNWFFLFVMRLLPHSFDEVEFISTHLCGLYSCASFTVGCVVCLHPLRTIIRSRNTAGRLLLEFWYIIFISGCMIKCRSPGGWYPWEAVQMEVDTTTTHTLLSEVVTGSFQWTSMYLAAHQLPRRCCTDFSSYRRKSTGARISSTGGPSERALCLAYLFVPSLVIIISPLWFVALGQGRLRFLNQAPWRLVSEERMKHPFFTLLNSSRFLLMLCLWRKWSDPSVLYLEEHVWDSISNKKWFSVNVILVSSYVRLSRFIGEQRKGSWGNAM